MSASPDFDQAAQAGSTEHMVCHAPFTVRRVVKWGHCDPAGVVYTVVFGEYVMSTAELFYAHLLGISPQLAKDRHGFGTPSRALSFDFRRSLRPDELFDTEVRVGNVGGRTYELQMRGLTLQGETVFTASLTPICVVRGERVSIEIPEVFRKALTDYQQRTQGLQSFVLQY